MAKKIITLLDGSIGQELVKRSGHTPTALWSTQVMLDNPDLVKAVHTEYFRSGAHIATTNTYPVHYGRLQAHGLEEKRFALWQAALSAANEAKDECAGLVAGSLGPLIASYLPETCPPAAEAALMYKEIVSVLTPQVDLLLIETMSSVNQAEGALMAATQQNQKPVWVAFSVDDYDGSQLRSGEPLRDIASLIKSYQPEAVLINCSRPESVTQAMPIISEFGVKFGAYANGFTKISDGFKKVGATVQALEERQDLSPCVYADFVMRWVEAGATIVGGCCEIGPAHVQEIARRLQLAGYAMGHKSDKQPV